MGMRLAIEGALATFPAGPPGWPPQDDDVLAALEAAWADGSWGKYHSSGTERLAALLCEMHKVPFALLCCSGTFAVELALRGLGVGEGHEVILAGYDFPGNFRSIEAVGARPVLTDICLGTWSLDAESLESAIGPDTRAVLVSHLHSGLADMRSLCQTAARHKLAVVEDACQAPGATVQGRLAGTWGDVGVLSFGGSKLLTAGRGGALLTRREDVLQRAKIFCERGNHAFPLSELQAAVIIPQLTRLADRNRQRHENAQRLLTQLMDCQLLRPVTGNPPESVASYYKLAWLFCVPPCSGRTRSEFLAAVQAEGIAMDAGFFGFTLRGNRRCRRASLLDQSRIAATDTVLLHHPVLLQSAATVDQLAAGVKKVVDAFHS